VSTFSKIFRTQRSSGHNSVEQQKYVAFNSGLDGNAGGFQQEGTKFLTRKLGGSGKEGKTFYRE